jgi:hypothetical protein
MEIVVNMNLLSLHKQKLQHKTKSDFFNTILLKNLTQFVTTRTFILSEEKQKEYTLIRDSEKVKYNIICTKLIGLN